MLAKCQIRIEDIVLGAESDLLSECVHIILNVLIQEVRVSLCWFEQSD